MDISYVVTFYNKFAYMPDLMRSIEAQGNDFTKELVIADDGSSDEEWARLKDFIASYEAYPVILVEAPRNTGPAQCFNRGLEAACGGLIVGIDADDVLNEDASRYYVEQLKLHDADFIFGRRRARTHKKVDATGEVVIDEPLSFVIKNQIVHMCFAAKAELLRAAGGADPRLFIQDQSLSLRMSGPLRKTGVAQRMVRSEVTTVYINSDEAGLSINTAQQHYDRFWMVMNFLDDHPELSAQLVRDLKDVGRSALWKMDRDRGGRPYNSRYFWSYLWGRLTGLGVSIAKMKQRAGVCFNGANVKKVALSG